MAPTIKGGHDGTIDSRTGRARGVLRTDVGEGGFERVPAKTCAFDARRIFADAGERGEFAEFGGRQRTAVIG